MNGSTIAMSTVEGYLADLDRALAGAEAATRQEITASVREHIDQRLAALDHEATRADVEAVLADLGSPQRVAASWYEDAPADAERARVLADAVGRSDADRSARSTGRLMVGLAVLGAGSSLVPFLGIVVAAAILVVTVVVFVRRLRGTVASTHGVAAIVIAAVGTLAALVLLLGLVWFTTAPSTSGVVTVG